MPRARQKSGSLKMNSMSPPFPQDPLPEEVSLIFSPETADELALKNSLDDHNVNRYTVSSNDVDDDETEFRIDLREDELKAARSLGGVLCFEDWVLWVRRG